MKKLLLLLALLSACDRLPIPEDPHAGHAAASGDVAFYTCPMHPSVKQPGPGKCPLCGMDLTPVTKAELSTGAVVVDAGRRARLGIVTGRVETRELHPTLELPAVVAWDRARLADVSARVQGYVESLPVAAPGARVRAGDVLLTLYSPELVATQEDLLAAATQARLGVPGAERRAEAARARLRRWGVPDARVEAVLAAGAAEDRLPVTAPQAGVVVEVGVVEGATVAPGQALFRIADPSRVWVEASLPEGLRVATGTAARVTAPGLAEAREGKVVAVEPAMVAETRAARVRVSVENADGALLPDAWATVGLALSGGPRLAVPEDAVIYTGPRRVVFVDAGEDRLVPRDVTIGVEADGWVEVTSGLAEGENIVTSGNFLVAADSRLKRGGEAHEHGGGP